MQYDLSSRQAIELLSEYDPVCVRGLSLWVEATPVNMNDPSIGCLQAEYPEAVDQMTSIMLFSSPMLYAAEFPLSCRFTRTSAGGSLPDRYPQVQI